MASRRNLYIAGIIAGLTGALFGYSSGFIGGVIVLPSFLRFFRLDGLPETELASARSAIVSLWLVGAVIGVPLGIPVCSRLGRRICLIFTAVLYLVGGILQLLTGGSLAVFMVARFINGLSIGTGTLVSPMYIAEISPPNDRGVLMSAFQCSVQLSALLGFWGAFIFHAIFPETNDLQWELPVIIQIVPGAILLIGSCLIPETPIFYAEKSQFHSAELSLSWLRQLPRGDADLLEELQEIQDTVEATEKMPQRSFWSELSKTHVRKRLHVGIGLMFAQNAVGLNALNYFAPVIFMSAGFTTVSSSLFLTGFFGFIKLFAALGFMFYFVHWKGNRFWLLWGLGVCGAAMVVLGVCVETMPTSYGDQEPPLSAGGVIAVLMVYVFTLGFTVSIGPISWNVCSEIFPLHINATCCAITTGVQWFFQILIAAITPYLIAWVGWGTYIIYAAFCFLSLIWVYFVVPETRNVPVGKPMDKLFGVKPEDVDEEVQEATDHLETTPLIQNERRRRNSLATYI